jgi:CheY-like chemotaxis protein
VVEDSGIGIASADRSRVFEEFVQLDNVGRDREKGVGLGLSIVAGIGELLGLAVTLDSTPGAGTRISFVLPTAQEQPASVIEVAPESEEDSPYAGLRLWVVEDDFLVRDALHIQLDAWSVDHDFARDRKELLALHDSDGAWPDAVMLDDMLGRGEQGLELAQWLATQMPAERIVLATGNVDPARVAKLQQSGLRLMRKPLTSDELRGWLRQCAQAVAPADSKERASAD